MANLMRPAAYKARAYTSVHLSVVQPTLSVVEIFLQPVMKRPSSRKIDCDKGSAMRFAQQHHNIGRLQLTLHFFY